MTETAIALLPESSDKAAWNPQQAALMESLGLRGEKNVNKNGSWTKVPFEAPPSIVEAFLYQIRRTGLDPVARQIYCIERGGKWGIQASIDGFRLIAERSRKYAGQTPVQWTADGVTWLDVWLNGKVPPAAARVGVYREGFAEPMWAVATYEGYVPRDRDGNAKPTGQWVTNPSNQLAKCAEMLGLRKAFPQDLSGLYGTEEMDQATRQPSTPGPARAEPAAQPEPVAAVAQSDWAARILDVDTVDDLRAVHKAAETAEELGRVLNPQRKASLDAVVEHFGLPIPPPTITVGTLIQVVKVELQKQPPEGHSDPASEEIVDAEVVESDAPTDRVTEWPTAQPGSGGRTVDPETGEELI